MNHRLNLGNNAERIAAEFLKRQNYQILQNNYFNHQGYRLGEADLIARDPSGKIIFVEVKARAGEKNSVVPEENITNAKIRKIEKIAWKYLVENQLENADWRIESVGIIFDFQKRTFSIRHIKNIRT